MRSFIFKIGTLAFCISIVVYSLTGEPIPQIIIKSFIIFISISILTSLVVIVVLMFTQKLEKEEESRRRSERQKVVLEVKNGPVIKKEEPKPPAEENVDKGAVPEQTEEFEFEPKSEENKIEAQ